MNTLQSIIEWIRANPWTTVAIVVYVLANVAPRPQHQKLTGAQKAFWLFVDRLCILTSGRLPGVLKMLLLDSPVLAPRTMRERKKRLPDKSVPCKEDDPDVELGEEESTPESAESGEK